MILHRLYRRFSAAAASSAVLTYHRIADEAWDPDGVCVPPDIFEQQLQFFTRHFRILPLSQLIEEWKGGRLKRNTIALSFDDGYNDNFTTALPLLERYGIPACFFITNQSSSFWWDRLKARLMASKNSGKIREVYTRMGFTTSPGLSQELLPEELYHLLAGKMKIVGEAERETILTSVDEKEPVDLPALMPTETLALLASKPGVEIGGHSVSHPMLGGLTATAIREELTLNKAYIEKSIGKRIHLLAYPFGDYNAAVIEQAKDLGFTAGLSTHHYSFRYAPSAFEIGRYNMGRETSPAFLLSLKR